MDPYVPDSAYMNAHCSSLTSSLLRSSNRKWGTTQVFGPLHLDEHTKALLVRIALLLRLDESLPNFVIDRAGFVGFRGAVEARNATPRQQTGFAQRRLTEEHSDLGAVREVGIGRPSAALPQRKVLVVEHHRAATRGNLSISTRQRRADQADMRWIGRIDVFLQRFWNCRQRSLHERLAYQLSTIKHAVAQG